MNLFIDTNTLVKLYHKEIGSDNLKSILKECKNDFVITISKIALVEMHSAFFKKSRD